MPPFAPRLAAAAKQSPEEMADGAWVNAELLSEVLEEGATVRHVDVQRAVGKGENYFSVLYRTRVEYVVGSSEEIRVRNLIVKGLPQGEFILAYVHETCAFRRENAIYGDVFPRLYAFADDVLGKNSFHKLSAEYHKTSRPDTLILDDLKPQGFIMASRRDRLDFAHSKLVVQNLARFHALSTAYSEKNPDYISQFEDKMFNEASRPRLKQIYEGIFKSFADEIKKWKGFEGITRKFDAMQNKYVDKLINACKVQEANRTVLAHGDCWVNNMMFKYAETGEPVDVCFVDFQLTRVASPALDLNYFLFTSPRTDVRERHFEELLKDYCEVFNRGAKELGYSGPRVTMEEVRREMDRMACFAFTAAISTMVSVLADPENIANLDELTEDDVGNGTNDNFPKVYASARFREAFESMLPYFDERGVFD